jgi:hypothetical protein
MKRIKSILLFALIIFVSIAIIDLLLLEYIFSMKLLAGWIFESLLTGFIFSLIFRSKKETTNKE